MVYAVAGGWLVLAVLVVACRRLIASDRRWRVAVLLLTLLFSLLQQVLFAAVTDDAFVSFRYAQNIADGNGPVFNIGDRAEGYTNFLWLVVIALPRAAFGAAVPTSAMVLSVLATLGCVLVAYFLADRVAELAVAPGAEFRSAVGVAAAVLTAGVSGLAVYGASGTEVPMFVLLMLAVVYALVAHRPVVAGVLVVAALMTCPEGLVPAVVAGLWLVIAAVRGRHTWWAPVGYLLGVLVFLVPWLVWRATYYHGFVPQPVRAPGPGWAYLCGFLVAHLAFLVPGMLAAGALVRARGRAAEARSALWLLFALAAGLIATAVVFARDPGMSWRLLTPVPPLLAVAAAGTYGALTAANPSPRPRTASRLVPVVAAGLTGFAVLASLFSPDLLARVRDWRTHSAQLAEVGEWLSGYLPPGSVVGAASPGAIASRVGSQLLIVGVGAKRATVAVPGGDGYTERQDCATGPDSSPAATFRRIGTPFWIAVYPRADEASRLIDDLDRAPGFQYVSCP